LSVSEVLFDTNAYSELIRGRVEAVEVMRVTPIIVMPLIVIAELEAGFRHGNRFTKNQIDLENFLNLSRVQLLASDRETATIYGKIHSVLLSKGQTIPTNDVWIAALAIQFEMPLFTFDTHFSRVENLRYGANTIELGL
jgi:tRNA(fMet)-specific endonuclease VapC